MTTLILTAIIYLTLFPSHRSHYHNYIDVYIDGSKTGNYVGCGVVCENTVLSYHLPTSFSAFSAEFFAIETALNLIASYSHKHFIIYSDSLSVLDTLQSYTYSPTFISVLEHYNEISKKGFNILFCWVQGYVGIKGDKAAKQACRILDCPVLYPNLKHVIKTLLRNKWQSEWDSLSNNKLKEFKTSISLCPTCTPRKNDVIITCLRLGHTRLTHRHLLLGENHPPICPHCHFSILTIHHLLTDCPCLRHLYRHYFNSSLPNLKNLLGEKPHTEIINFLREANFHCYI